MANERDQQQQSSSEKRRGGSGNFAENPERAREMGRKGGRSR